MKRLHLSLYSCIKLSIYVIFIHYEKAPFIPIFLYKTIDLSVIFIQYEKAPFILFN